MFSKIVVGLVSTLSLVTYNGSYSDANNFSKSTSQYTYSRMLHRKSGIMKENCQISDISDGTNSSHSLYITLSISLTPGDMRSDFNNSSSRKASVSVSFEKKQFYSSSSSSYLDTCSIDMASCSGTPKNGTRNYYTSAYSADLEYGYSSTGDSSVRGGFSTSYSVSSDYTDPQISFSKEVNSNKVTLTWFFNFINDVAQKDTFNTDVVAFCNINTNYDQYDDKSGCFITVLGEYVVKEGVFYDTAKINLLDSFEI